MSEKYGHADRKTYKTYTGNLSSRTKARTKSPKNDTAALKMESKTPPLPARRTSIDELIKKRESLKQELKKIVKHSDSDLPRNSSMNHKHSKNYCAPAVQPRKRTNVDKEPPNATRIKILKEYSPEHTGDYVALESEDEETIIEKSRQRRKQLLETFNIAQEQPEENTPSNEEETKNEVTMEISETDVKSTSKQFTDMFSEVDENIILPDDVDKQIQCHVPDNWDDEEGYYNVTIGDQIDKRRYTIKSILGQGVFSNVICARDRKGGNDVAIKIIRNNNVTYKTGLNEINILKEIREADPDDKYHCIRMVRHFTHKHHLCMVMESLYMDLRHVIKKYGHHHGLNMKAVISYSRQLLVALRLLKKLNIVHADIKPDNMLVNTKKNVLKLCDFGSASKIDNADVPTPYLVSRFYRAPEIILGVPYKHSVDIWSAACTMYEIATGKILFSGNSNNKMLKCFMDMKGQFSAKLIKRGLFKDQHFNYKNNFLLHKKNVHTGRQKYVEMLHIPITRDLQRDLNKNCKCTCEDEETKIMQLKDLLDKMLTIDANHRYSVTDCLKHIFIREKL